MSNPTITNQPPRFVLPDLTFRSSQVTSKINSSYEQLHNNKLVLQKKVEGN